MVSLLPGLQVDGLTTHTLKAISNQDLGIVLDELKEVRHVVAASRTGNANGEVHDTPLDAICACLLMHPIVH